jgi:signal transduction histidine kinase
MPDPASNPLFVLILEDHPADFDLVVHELRRFGLEARCQRTETEAEYLLQLQAGPDIILADYMVAGFDALRALRLLQESGLVIPFIVLTGAVSEDTVVECMRRGAADYLLKDRIKRLGPAVQRALEEAELRRQKQRAERSLRQMNVELEEQYQKAQTASRMKSIFLANMSHELRTPLTAIIGFAELLVDGRVGPVALEQLDLLQEILGNGRHLLGLINEVLDLAKVESGTMPFRPELMSISEIVGETIGGLRTLAAQKRIGLLSDVRVPEEKISLDPQRLKQVLLNYLSNALKFTPPEGRVTIRARPDGGSFLRLEVEDTGIGIARENIGRLFQDFHQIDDGMSKQVQGTGLGLALTKRIVEAQGGRVGVDSAPGKGSTFFAVLPYTSAEAEQDSAVMSALP